MSARFASRSKQDIAQLALTLNYILHNKTLLLRPQESSVFCGLSTAVVALGFASGYIGGGGECLGYKIRSTEPFGQSL